MKHKVKSLYFKARHPNVAKNICLKNPTCANESIRWLGQEWRTAERAGKRNRMKLLKQSAVVAANRAKVAKDNKRYSTSERKEFAKVYQLYKNWYEGKILPRK